MCLVEHITAPEQSKGSANRQVTLPNAPHKPQNEHQSKQPVDDIKLYLLGCYMNPAVSCSTRPPNSAQTQKNHAGATRTLHSHVAPAFSCVKCFHKLDSITRPYKKGPEIPDH